MPRSFDDVQAGDYVGRLVRAVDAANALSKELRAAGIPHAVIGGLAVIHHGYARLTTGAELIVTVTGEGFFSGTPLTVVPGVEFKRDGLSDALVLYVDRGEEFVSRDVEHVYDRTSGTPVIGMPTLIYLKLKAGRAKDRADVVELLRRAKPDSEKIKRYLARHAPRYVPDFERAVRAASRQIDASQGR